MKLRYLLRLSLVNKSVSIGKNVKIGFFNVITGNVTIESNVTIGNFCNIGQQPEHLKHWNSKNNGVWICSGTVLTGNCTIDAGIDTPTFIEPDSFIMKQTHIGHDCQIGKENVIAPGARLGGYVSTGEQCYFGLNSTVKPRLRVPDGTLLGMGSVLLKIEHTSKGWVYTGVPAVINKKNPKYKPDTGLNRRTSIVLGDKYKK